MRPVRALVMPAHLQALMMPPTPPPTREHPLLLVL
jgi:hypothetical protein